MTRIDRFTSPALLRAALAFALAATAAQAGAQTLTGITLEPTTAQPGQEVKLTANFDVANDAYNCNVRIRWGDGQEKMFHVNQSKDVPLVLTHAYAAPGSYEVKVEPKNNLPAFKCLGKGQKTVLTVAAPAAAAQAAAASSARVSTCPTGWKAMKGSVKKNGSYTCSAKPGTALPDPKPTCPGELTYFENAKKGQFGCRP